MDRSLITENVSLRPYHTFGIESSARFFGVFRSKEELQQVLAEKPKEAKQLLVLGGGSNVLFTKNFDGLVIRNEIGSIGVVSEDDHSVCLRVGAGVNWHDFVLHCIENGWGGVENLSLIPGCVGASPMQNIGAYGVEIASVFQELTAFHIREKANYVFREKECAFGYRESVFKNKYRDQFVITDVTFRLSKEPGINTSYGAIEQELHAMGVQNPGIRDVSNAVTRIRTSKLPDPAVLGNAGSFFKNPVVPNEKFAALKNMFPGIVGYSAGDATTKLAAGWLIENTGPLDGVSWKGYREGDAGCHERQALVLVNHGKASGEQIRDLSARIRASVLAKFGVALEPEVNIY